MDKLRQWFVSDMGRRIMGRVAIVAASTTCVGHLAPHVWLKSKFVEIIHLYRAGKPWPMDPELSRRAEDTIYECDIDAVYRNKIRFFHVFGSDVYSVGSTLLSRGADVGIPIHFSYGATKDVDVDKIEVFERPVNWNSKEGQSLRESFILSPMAQKAAIAGQIYYCNNYRVMIRSLLSGAVLMTVYYICSDINGRFKLYNRPLIVRASMYAVVGLLGLGFYLSVSDNVNVEFEKQSDELVVKMGRDYIMGGVEYYEKLVERNKAIYHLAAEDGKKYMTANGNYKSTFRTKHLPCVQKLDYYKSALAKEPQKPSSKSV